MATSGISTADSLSTDLTGLQQQMSDLDANVKSLVQTAGDGTQQFRADVHGAVDAYNQSAQSAVAPAGGGPSQDGDYIAQLVSVYTQQINQALASINNKNSNLAAQINGLTAQMQKIQSDIEALAKTVGTGTDPSLTEPTAPIIQPTNPGDTPAAPVLNPNPDPSLGDSTAQPWGGAGTTPGGGGTTPGGATDPPVQQPLDGLGSVGAGTAAPSTTPAEGAGMPPVAAPATAGGGDLSSMMGPLMDAMAMQGLMRPQNQQLDGPDDERRRRDEDDEPQAAPPATAKPEDAQQKPLAKNVPGTDNARPAGPPSGSAAPAQSGPGPRKTEPDGSLVYTFPDGRTQKVSAVVAQALDAAFGNAAATDARAAYAKTTVQWSSQKNPGERVDPYRLITGDIARWDNREALIVAFGPDAGNTLEVVVDGHLQPFSSEMTDNQGIFGDFDGFFHPRGIDVAQDQPTGSDAGAAAPALPVPSGAAPDQSMTDGDAQSAAHPVS